MQIKVGFIDSPTSLGNQTYTISGMTDIPKLVQLFGANHGISGADQDDHHKFFGAAISTTAQHGWGVEPLHGVSPSNCVMAQSKTHCVYVPDANGTRILDAEFVSFGAGQFTLNWTDFWTSPIRLYYVAWSGSELQFAIGNGQARTSFGLQDVVTGFQADLIWCSAATNAESALPVTLDQFPSSGCIGFGTSTAQGVTGWRSESNINPQRCSTLQLTSHILVWPSMVGVVSRREARLNAILSDRFQLDWTTVNSAAARYFWIAIKGIGAKVGAFTATPGVGNNQVVSGLGFNPLWLFMQSANKTAAATAQAHYRTSWGATDGTNKWSIWGGERDSVATTISATRADIDRVFRMGAENNTGPSVDTHAAIDTVTLGTGQFTAHYDVITTTGQEVLYLAVGPAAGGGGGGATRRKHGTTLGVG